MTSLTNAQIVAELGWTRKAIKSILGVTPLTMRPPFGDIGQSFFSLSLVRLIFKTKCLFFFFSDDRVRAICLAMGMIPVLWTSTKDGGKFDTNGLSFFLSFVKLRINLFIYSFCWLDWMVAGGSIPGNQSLASFEQILTNATQLSTGYICYFCRKE